MNRAILLLLLAAPLHAAHPLPPSAIESAQAQVRGRQFFAPRNPYAQAGTPAAPDLYPGESADLGPQYLLLQQQPARTWFEAGIDAQYYYTSNVSLTEKGNADTGVVLTTIHAEFAPPAFALAGGELAVRAGYRHQRYNYGLDSTANQLNNLDFDVGTVYLGGRWTFRENWRASLGLDYNRYLSHESDWAEFYTELLPQWGLERTFTVGAKDSLSLSYFGGYHFTYSDPDPTTHSNDRLDTILALAYSHELRPGLVLQPFYRWQQSHYTENTDRNDVFHTVGVTVAYFFNEWAAVRFFSSFEVRDSTDSSIQDYHKWDTGGGVAFAVRF